jgi:hypothetical protein
VGGHCINSCSSPAFDIKGSLPEMELKTGVPARDYARSATARHLRLQMSDPLPPDKTSIRKGDHRS